MDRILRNIAFVFTFLVMFCMVVYSGSLRQYKEVIKDSLDLSTKAAALQIDTNPALISQGIFHIDPIKARQAFITVMASNLNTTTNQINQGIVDFEVINSPGTYTNIVTNVIYTVTAPTVVAILKFSFNSPLYKKDIVIQNNFAGSQLVSK